MSIFNIVLVSIVLSVSSGQSVLVVLIICVISWSQMLLSRTVTRCNVPYVTFPSLCLFVILFIQRIYFSCLVSFLCFPFIKLVPCLVDNYATFNWKLIYLIALRTLRPQQTERRDYKVIILSSDCHHEDIWITGEQLTPGAHYRDNDHSGQHWGHQDLHKIMNNHLFTATNRKL